MSEGEVLIEDTFGRQSDVRAESALVWEPIQVISRQMELQLIPVLQRLAAIATTNERSTRDHIHFLSWIIAVLYIT